MKERLLILLTLLVAGAAAPAAEAQIAKIMIFNEPEGGGDYYASSYGARLGDDWLRLQGSAMPLEREHVYSGEASGALEYQHRSGSWNLFIARPGWEVFDVSRLDSLVFFLNAPAPVTARELPLIGLEDNGQNKSVPVALPVGDALAYSAEQSGWSAGGPDVRYAVSYIPIRPYEEERPGFPESFAIRFTEDISDTSTVGVGMPAVGVPFYVESSEGDYRYDFRFRDRDKDGRLASVGDYLEVLTLSAADGRAALYPAWRIEVTFAATGAAPSAGDRYNVVLATVPAIDGDPSTWERIAMPISRFATGGIDLSRVKDVRFTNGAPNESQHTLWVDHIHAIGDGRDLPKPAPPEGPFVVRDGDGTVILHWEAPDDPAVAGYHIFQFRDGYRDPLQLTDQPVRTPHYADMTVENGYAYAYTIASVNEYGVTSFPTDEIIAHPHAMGTDEFIDYVQQTAFDYFWYEANPANGLVRDRSRPTSAASVAAVGFGLSALTVGIDHGWITREEGLARVLATLETFYNGRQGTEASGTIGYKGFFYHFLNMNTATRSGTSELSTIDTALLMGGVLHVREYFDGEDSASTRVRRLADSLYARVDWAWAQARPPAISHGWRPESGFIPYDYLGYNEAMILYLLALGSPTHPVGADAWAAYTSGYDGDWQSYYGLTFLTFPPMFGHQYSHVWIDFRDRADAFMREKGSTYFQNSVLATRAQQAYAIDNPFGWLGYGENFWGLTASDGYEGYRARGAPPSMNDAGTISPTAAGGSYAFTPEQSAAALRHMYRTYPRVWGPYGFRDALNPARDWYATDFLGIDQGPIVLMIENGRTGAIWEAFMRNEAIQRGLARAGFTAYVSAEEASGVRSRLHIEALYPSPGAGKVQLRLSEGGAVPLDVRVYDVLGREVQVAGGAERGAGARAIEVDLTALPAGIYYVQVRSGEEVVSRSVVKL